MGDISPEEKKMVEDEFDKLYSEDPRFKLALEGTKIANLTIRDKYELIIAYTRKHDGISSEEGGSRFGRRPSEDNQSIEVDG
jgi:hypothetical protein